MSTAIDITAGAGARSNIDPVCGMTVKPDTQLRFAYRDKTYLFCNPKCLAKFSANPEKYLYGNVGKGGEIKDPVCGMTVEPDSPLRYEHEGKIYLFCNPKCQAKFSTDPERYLHPVPADSRVVIPGAVYICPMDPEVRESKPGSCPICGMALEPDMAFVPGKVPVEDKTELNDMTRRFWVSTALALPVFMLAMTADLLPQAIPSSVSMTALQWSEFLLATPVVLWGGWPFFQRGWASVVNRHLNMFTLIALGVGVAWVYSVIGMLLPGIFPPAMHSADRHAAGLFRGGRDDHRAGAAGPGDGTARAQPDQRRDQAAARPGAQDRAHRARPMVSKKTFRWNRCRSAMCCACAPAKRFRWTA